MLRDHPGYQEPDTFDIAHCPRCHTGFARAEGVETGPVYEAIYRQIEHVPAYKRYLTYAKGVLETDAPLDYLAEKEEAYWAVRQHLRDSGLPRGSRILEVGSGLGYLTYALGSEGYDVRGVDISEAAVRQAADRYGDRYVSEDLFGWSESQAGRYDLVVMTEVIEHLEDVYPFLRACLRMVRPGGHLLITTPNREAWAPDVAWAADAPPVHLWWFSRASFEAIGARLGCSVSFVDFRTYPGADSWRLQHVEGSPRAILPPTLDASGRLVARFRPPGFFRRLFSRVARATRPLRHRLLRREPAPLAGPDLPASTAPDGAGAERPAHLWCPALGVVLGKPAAPAAGDERA